MNKQIGRNDPCPCGSGKKYKKCCELRLGQRKFNASLLSSETSNPSKTSEISTHFFSKIPSPKLPPSSGTDQSKE